jgi:hypothetical protein
MIEEPGRWWYLELAAEFPELEIYSGHGWGPAEELGQYELGERVMDHEAHWLFTRIYSTPRDRHWAAVSIMFGMIIERIRQDLPEEEKVLMALRDEDWREAPVSLDKIPPGWMPDTQGWIEVGLP